MWAAMEMAKLAESRFELFMTSLHPERYDPDRQLPSVSVRPRVLTL
jgi:hypothetical protein